MRVSFFKVLVDTAKTHKDIYLLTADLGFKLFDSFRTQFPERFFDIGVAESNMIGIASGLSLCGKNVYCYSIIPFLTMRAFEQIRIDIAYQNLNVKLIGVGCGFTYGLEGFTHFGLEDISLMRSLPNMNIVVPADPLESQCLAKITSEHEGPLYIRLGRSNEPVIHNSIPDFKIGKAMILKEGKEVTLFAIGNMVFIALQVADMLKNRGIDTTIVNMHTIKPLDTGLVREIASIYKAIFSLEEHSINGGLGTAIAEVLAETGYSGIFKRFGIPNELSGHVGKADYLREQYGLSPDKIFQKILTLMKGQT